MLPRPMLPRPGAVPTDQGWAFELKYDGSRAIVSTERGLEMRSRRGWNMTVAWLGWPITVRPRTRR